jgi:hypothetical protein
MTFIEFSRPKADDWFEVSYNPNGRHIALLAGTQQDSYSGPRTLYIEHILTLEESEAFHAWLGEHIEKVKGND